MAPLQRTLPSIEETKDLSRPTMTAVYSARDLRNRSGELLRAAQDGHLAVVTKHGRPAFVAVPFDTALLQEGVHRRLALSLFEGGQMSLGQAAKLAGLSAEEFIELLGAYEIVAVDYPADELAQDLENAL